MKTLEELSSLIDYFEVESDKAWHHLFHLGKRDDSTVARRQHAEDVRAVAQLRIQLAQLAQLERITYALERIAIPGHSAAVSP